MYLLKEQHCTLEDSCDLWLYKARDITSVNIYSLQYHKGDLKKTKQI